MKGRSLRTVRLLFLLLLALAPSLADPTTLFEVPLPSDGTTAFTETTTTDPNLNKGWCGSSSKRAALLMAIIAVCVTIIVVAVCCGLVCFTKMRFRVRALQLRSRSTPVTCRFTSGTKPDGHTEAGENHYTSHMNAAASEEDRWFPAQEIFLSDDQWLIQKNSLLVTAEKLGSGAFATVFRGLWRRREKPAGQLLCRPPIEGIYGKLHVSLELNDTNDVAVKVIPLHATYEQRSAPSPLLPLLQTRSLSCRSICKRVSPSCSVLAFPYTYSPGLSQ